VGRDNHAAAELRHDLAANFNFTPDKTEIERVAKQVRRCLLRADFEVGQGDGRRDDLLCDLAARLLAEALARLGHKVTFHVGRVLMNWNLYDHWWASVGGIRVDITSAQFGKPPVIVADEDEPFPWTPHFSGSEAECQAFDAERSREASRQMGHDHDELMGRVAIHDAKVTRRFWELMERAGKQADADRRVTKRVEKKARRRVKAARRKARGW
jgi:hypothetical protein